MSEKWMDTYDAVFFVSVGTLVIGFFGLVIKYCLKSKCENVNLCCGLITIHRRVDLETQYEIHEIDASATDPPPNSDVESALPEVKPRRAPQRRSKALLDLKSTPSLNPSDSSLSIQYHPAEVYQVPPKDPPTRSELASN